MEHDHHVSPRAPAEGMRAVPKRSRDSGRTSTTLRPAVCLALVLAAAVLVSYGAVAYAQTDGPVPTKAKLDENERTISILFSESIKISEVDPSKIIVRDANNTGVSVNMSGSTVAPTYEYFLTKYGNTGSGDLQFKQPSDIAFNSTNHIFVADSRNHRIQILNSGGGHEGYIGNGSESYSNGQGGDGKFSWPRGVAVNSADRIFVADSGNDRILEFHPNSTFANTFDPAGRQIGIVENPRDVAIGDDDTVFVADSKKHRILIIKPNGGLESFGAHGTRNEQFIHPEGVAVDKEGRIWIADTDNHRVKIQLADKKFIAALGAKNGTIPIKGSEDGQFFNPRGIAVDNVTGHVFVADTNNHRIQVFYPNGTFLGKIGSADNTASSGDGNFTSPRGVAVNGTGHIFVADTGNNRIQVFPPSFAAISLKLPPSTVLAIQGMEEPVLDIKASAVTGFSGNANDEADREFDMITGDETPPQVNLTRVEFSNLDLLGVGGTFDVFMTSEPGLLIYNATINMVNVSESFNMTEGEYSVRYTVSEGDNDIRDEDILPVSIYLQDAAGNRGNKIGNANITDSLPRIDANSPKISVALVDPPSGHVGAGETLEIVLSSEMGLDVVRAEINGKNVSGTFDGSAGDGTYKISYTVDSDDPVFRDSASIPVDITLKDMANNTSNRLQSIPADKAPGIDGRVPGLTLAELDMKEHRIHAVFNEEVRVYATDASKLNVRIDSGSGSSVILSNSTVMPLHRDFSSTFGSEGNRTDQFMYPSGIAVAGDGTMVVADSGNHRIQIFHTNGTITNINKTGGGYGSGDGEFHYPRGVAVNSTGHIFVADADRSRVQVLDPYGGFVRKFVSDGTGDAALTDPRGVVVDHAGRIIVVDKDDHKIRIIEPDGSRSSFGGAGPNNTQFQGPEGVAVDGTGRIWVADTGNHRVKIHGPDGAFIGAFGKTDASGDPDDGDGDRQFDRPSGIAVDDSTGNVFVADTDNDRIQVLTSDGTFLREFGSEGNGTGQFNKPRGVTVVPDGRLLVADTDNHRVHTIYLGSDKPEKFDLAGNGTDQLMQPSDVAFNSTGHMFVADSENHRIQVFHPNGSHLNSIGNKNSNGDPIEGSGSNGFKWPRGVSVDDSNRIIVADAENDRIVVLHHNGTFASEFNSTSRVGSGSLDSPRGVAVDHAGRIIVADKDGGSVKILNPDGSRSRLGSQGSADRQFQGLEGVAVNSTGHIFVADTGNHRVKIYSPDGDLLNVFGATNGTSPINGSGNGQFSSPRGIAIDSSTGNMFVADTNNHRIQVLGPDGAFLREFGSEGNGTGQFQDPRGVTVGPDGRLFVADTNNHRVQEFALISNAVSLDLQLTDVIEIQKIHRQESSRLVLDIDAGAVRDGAGNLNVAANRAFDTITNDTTGPQVNLTRVVPNSGLLGVGGTLDVLMTSETGLTVYNATINMKTASSGKTAEGEYWVKYTVSEGDDDVVNSTNLHVSIYMQDAAGNLGNEITRANFIDGAPSIDANSPEIQVQSVTPPSSQVRSGGTLEIVLSSDTGLDVVRADVNGRNVSSSFVNVGDGTYKLNYTVGPNDPAVRDSAPIPADITLKDAAGNPSNRLQNLPANVAPGIGDPAPPPPPPPPPPPSDPTNPQQPTRRVDVATSPSDSSSPIIRRGSGGGGGGGGGGGSSFTPSDTGSGQAGSLTLYTVSWDCNTETIRTVTSKGDHDITLLTADGKVKAVPLKTQDLVGRTIHSAPFTDDIITLSVVGQNDGSIMSIRETIRPSACTGDVTYTSYVPPTHPFGPILVTPPPTTPVERDEPGLAPFVDLSADPSDYVKRYLFETAYMEWFDTHYPKYASICEAVGLDLDCIDEYQSQLLDPPVSTDPPKDVPDTSDVVEPPVSPDTKASDVQSTDTSRPDIQTRPFSQLAKEAVIPLVAAFVIAVSVGGVILYVLRNRSVVEAG